MSCADNRQVRWSIVEASAAEQLHRALREFSVADITVYRGARGTCQCGEPIEQGHMLVNKRTGVRLGEFGPHCLVKLQGDALIHDMRGLTRMHQLHESLQDPGFRLQLSRTQFTREALWYMYRDGAFSLAAEFTGWFDYKAYRYFDRLLHQRTDGSMTSREIRVNDTFLHNCVAEYLRENPRLKTATAASEALVA